MFSTKTKQNWSKFKTFKYPNNTINHHVQHVDSLFTASTQHSHNKCSGDTRIQRGTVYIPLSKQCDILEELVHFQYFL